MALIGNPNTGKTTLFNALTGGTALTGNYPGVTVDKRVGTMRQTTGVQVRILDLPGTYSLAARSPDEMVAVDVLLGRRDDTPRPEVAVVVVDASNVERNLYLVTQVMEAELPTVVALNLVDEAEAQGIDVDAEALSDALGVPVVPTVASRGDGVHALRLAIEESIGSEAPPRAWSWPQAVETAVEGLGEALAGVSSPPPPRAELRRALLDETGEAERRLRQLGGDTAGRAIDDARASLAAAGLDVASIEADVRHAFIARVGASSIDRPVEPDTTFSDRIDGVLTHRVWGSVALVLIMTVVFMSIFSWAAPIMDFVDGTIIGGLQAWAEGWGWLGDGALKSLVIDGIIGGVGSVVIFLPQILILFFFMGLLEGCGYMSRAAFLMDRLLRRCGLSGRSFIPMLSSFACAIPGVMSARTIGNRQDRLVTILVAPLMSCSARIPVYVIFIAAFVPAVTVLGFLNLQGLVFVAMYFVGILVAIPVAYFLRRTFFRGEEAPSFMVELPPYRRPQLRVVIQRMLAKGMDFLRTAGTIIFAASIVIWALSYFPRPDPSVGAEAQAAVEAFDETLTEEERRFDIEQARQAQAVLAAEAQNELLGQRAREAYEAFLADHEAQRLLRATEREHLASAVDHAVSGEALRGSYLGRFGRAIEPVFAPMGWDWKVSSAVVASFPAREVVVSTLGVLYNLGPDEDEGSETLQSRLQGATWDHGPRKGKRVFDLAGAIALMVFFALCAQCVSTLAVIRREAGGWKWAVFAFVYMTLLAYVGAAIVAVVLRALA